MVESQGSNPVQSDQTPLLSRSSQSAAQSDPGPTTAPHNSETVKALLAIATLSWVLSLLSNLRYGFGRRSPWDHGHQDDVGFTPFTASLVPVLLFWTVMTIAQGLYLGQFFSGTSKQLTWHFVTSNVLLLAWSYLFARSHYILAEILAVLNFSQLTCAYLVGKSYAIRPLPNWIAVHGATVVFPMIWSFYLVFWNGAVMVGARYILSRLLANILIWLFLLVPGTLLLLLGDWLVGFSASWITLAIGFGQLFTKIFALQWIIAFAISTILLVASVYFAFVPSPLLKSQSPMLGQHSQAPLVTDN